MIEKGQLVMYRLSADDAAAINRQRTTGGSIADRMKRRVLPSAMVTDAQDKPITAWPEGAQAHIGNAVREGMEFPGIVVENFGQPGEAIRDSEKAVNLQVWLDGSDSYWATSRREDSGKEPAPGTFRRIGSPR